MIFLVSLTYPDTASEEFCDRKIAEIKGQIFYNSKIYSDAIRKHEQNYKKYAKLKSFLKAEVCR